MKSHVVVWTLKHFLLRDYVQTSMYLTSVLPSNQHLHFNSFFLMSDTCVVEVSVPAGWSSRVRFCRRPSAGTWRENDPSHPPFWKWERRTRNYSTEGKHTIIHLDTHLILRRNYNHVTLPDHPPAVQQFVNDLHSFSNIQRNLVILLGLVGLISDVQLPCRDTQPFH